MTGPIVLFFLPTVLLLAAALIPTLAAGPPPHLHSGNALGSQYGGPSSPTRAGSSARQRIRTVIPEGKVLVEGDMLFPADKVKGKKLRAQVPNPRLECLLPAKHIVFFCLRRHI